MAKSAPTDSKSGSVSSADGTQIGWIRFGEGPPLIVCHGAFTIADHWAGFAQAMGGSRSVYLYDRRGRGRSLDSGKPHSLDAEMDDLAAMVAHAGPDAAVLGHSFGGGCALMYALRDGFAGRLVLYEPVHSLPRPLSGGNGPRLEALVAAGDMDAAARFSMTAIVRMDPGELEMMAQTPLWPGLAAMTPLFGREVAALDTIAPSAEALGQLRARTWLLVGDRSVHDPNFTCAAALVEHIHGLTLYPIRGQGHVAYLLDPPLLARIVERCLSEAT